jgi:predicted DNA-binding transcriptional regulator AlpA
MNIADAIDTEQLLDQIAVPTRKLYPLAEVRTLLGGISTATLYRRLNDGSLPTVRLGGRRFVRAADLDALIDGLHG